MIPIRISISIPCSLFVFLGAFALYAASAVPSVYWFDSAELSYAAFHLEVSHAPGQPLHALLGALFAWIPLGDIAFRVNLLGAVCGALLCAGTYACAVRLGVRAQVAAAGSLLLALSPSLLRESSRAEVYTLCAALLAFALERVLAFRKEARAHSLAAAALLLGLAAGAHELLALLGALALAVPLAGPLARAPRRLLFLLGGGVVGLLVLGYLPAAAHRGGWGEANTARGFMELLLARSFQHLPGEGPGRIASAIELGRLGIEMVGLPVLALAAFAPLCGRSDRAGILGAGLLGATALFSRLVFGRSYVGHPDTEGYILLLVPMMVLLACAGAEAVLLRAAARARPLAALGTLLVVAELVHFLPLPARAEHRFADALSAGLLAGVPPRGAVIATSDHLLFPAWYAQKVEGARPDVTIFSEGLASSSWYLERVKASQPFRYVPYVDDGRVVPAPGGRAGILMAFARRNRARPESALPVALFASHCDEHARAPRAAEDLDRRVHAFAHLQAGDFARGNARYADALAQYLRADAALDGAPETPPAMPEPPTAPPPPQSLPPLLRPREPAVLVSPGAPLARAAQLLRDVYGSPRSRALAEEAMRKGATYAESLLE